MKKIIKMPIQNLRDDDDEFENELNSLISDEENVEVTESVPEPEKEKKDPFMTGVAIVCGAALVSSIAGGIVSIVNGVKVSKFLKSKQN
jgi:hypothetical protein